MTPTDRTIEVLEYLMAAGSKPVKQVDIVRDLALSPATLNRIVKILSDRGYVFRTSEKYLVRNFVLERTVTMSDAYLAELESAIQALTEKTGAAAEIIVVTGHELLWRMRTEHPDPGVTIRARPGHQRTLFEFDALSRLYLSTLEPEVLDQRFDLIGFFNTGNTSGRQISFLEENDVRQAIEETRGRDFACDKVANHLGVRRFVTLVEDPEGRFQHLISIADTAPPGTGTGEISAAYRDALVEERQRLMAFLEDEKKAREATVRLRLA